MAGQVVEAPAAPEDPPAATVRAFVDVAVARQRALAFHYRVPALPQPARDGVRAARTARAGSPPDRWCGCLYPDGMVLDLNSDLGEGFGVWPLTDDDALLDVVTSANVACGFHAGDPTVLRRVTERAAERGVAVGAQVGYRDLAGFGRRFIDVDPAELVNDVVYQIGALDGFARIAGTRVAYVKPHGALYNAVAHHTAQAEAVVDAVRRYDAALPVLGLPGSELLRLADEAALPVVAEAFADRAYTPEGTLVSRREPGAVVADADAVVARSVRMATEGVVTAIDGTDVPARPRSLCLHGDTAGAVRLAGRIRAALIEAGVELGPFAAPPASRA